MLFSAFKFTDPPGFYSQACWEFVDPRCRTLEVGDRVKLLIFPNAWAKRAATRSVVFGRLCASSSSAGQSAPLFLLGGCQ